MGSPDFAVPVLRRLAEQYPISGVITQPDRPAGRGRQLAPPPVKTLALKLDLTVLQPERLRGPDAFEALAALAPQLIIVAAYGQILRQNVLELPQWGCLNVHGSLLPRWRGAAPIQASLLNGDTHTGVTIMKMDAGIDTGAILSQREIPINPADTTGTLFPRVAEAGADLLIETLPGYLAGAIQPTAQDESKATYARMLKKEDGLLSSRMTGEEWINRIRAFTPWPGAFIKTDDSSIRIGHAEQTSRTEGTPGLLGVIDHTPAVRAADCWLLLTRLQPPGRKMMSGRDFLAGGRTWVGYTP